MELVRPSSKGLAQAVDVLRRGEVLAYPTETVYGLGCDPWNSTAVRELARLKGRDETRPFLLVIGALDQLDAFVTHVPSTAKGVIERFWPGPLSLILPGRPTLLSPLRNQDGAVCVRFSSSPLVQELCVSFGGGLTSTSANRAGEPPCMVLSDFHDDGVALGLDAGPLSTGLASTVYDSERGVILRSGAVSQSELDG